jgi:hypothetical protein
MTDNDQDMYDSVLAPEEAPVEEAPKEEAAPERPRDDKGRFAAKTEAEEAAEPVEAPVEAAPVAEPEKREDHRIPLTELLNEREKRQAEQRRAETLMRELESLRQQLQPPAAPPPDQFQDPEGYNAHWEQRFQMLQQQHQQSIRQVIAENSLARADDKYGELFRNGYEAVMTRAQEGDPTVAKMVANSPNPGEAIVQWYKREETLKAVGDDPKAYANKVLEEALSNPEFLAKALEKAKGVASQQPSHIQLPPSLNKAAAAQRSDDTGPVSDRQLYEHSTIGR